MSQLMGAARASTGWRAQWRKNAIRGEGLEAKRLAERLSRLAVDYNLLHWHVGQLVDPNPISGTPTRLLRDAALTLTQAQRKLGRDQHHRPLKQVIAEFQDHLTLTTGRWWDADVASLFNTLPRRRKKLTPGAVEQNRRRQLPLADTEEGYVREWVNDLTENNIRKILGDVRRPLGPSGPKIVRPGRVASMT